MTGRAEGRGSAIAEPVARLGPSSYLHAVDDLASLGVEGGRGPARRTGADRQRTDSATPTANSSPAVSWSWIVAAHAGFSAAGTRVE